MSDERMLDEQLVERAREFGVASSYVDTHDQRHAARPETVRAVCDLLDTGTDSSRRPAPFDDVVLVRGGVLRSGVSDRAISDPARSGAVRVTVDTEDGGHLGPISLDDAAEFRRRPELAELPVGLHTLRWALDDTSSAHGVRPDGECTLLVAPRRFPAPDRERPELALFAPAYSLWSDGEPLPSYDGLARLGATTAELGVATIATLPLYAPGLGREFQASPYSPVSRFHWNEALVPDRLLGSASPRTGGDRIDWSHVVATRTSQLARALEALTDAEQADLDHFVAGRPEIGSYAAFMSAATTEPARLYELGQRLAEHALGDLAGSLRTNGQALALDLPVGGRAHSWESATWPELFITAASIGAPPDTFFAGGQDWALPPLNPTASRRDGHRVWAQLLRTACRFAGILRIDHVMQVHRLWWIPAGNGPADGVYVHYPADELLAVAAIVAAETDTLMVGENLGTVPPVMATLLDDWGLIGMYEEGFTLHDWVGPVPTRTGDRGSAACGDSPPGPLGSDTARPVAALPPVPPRTWAGIRTHDMPALAATARDLDLRHYRAALAAHRDGDVDSDGPHGDTRSPSDGGRRVDPDDADALLVDMLTRLRSSRAFEVVVDLDDLLGVTAAHNVPGTIDDTNWTRRVDQTVDDVGRSARVSSVLSNTTPPPNPDRADRSASRPLGAAPPDDTEPR